MAAIYDFIGAPLFGRDPEHIEPCYDMVEFDLRLGTPGLHDVRGAVRPNARRRVLPPDLFQRYDGLAFWQDPAQLPKTVRMV